MSRLSSFKYRDPSCCEHIFCCLFASTIAEETLLIIFFSLYLASFFSLVTLKIFSLSLIIFSFMAKKSCAYVGRVTSVVPDTLRPCRLWPAWLLCQGRGFYRQEYWCILANTGWHTLLEHYISCCPSCQLPWVSCAARTPVTQATAPPHLASQGQIQVLQGSLRRKNPGDNPHAEVEIKPQLKPRGSVAKEEDPVKPAD